jgi:hypothetical protein
MRIYTYPANWNRVTGCETKHKKEEQCTDCFMDCFSAFHTYLIDIAIILKNAIAGTLSS